ncbi:MAG: transcription antitermination factor NusB [Deltaproteobacteria bacterium]|nr:transcription antitermination factor NusB [Deltaproteobacteria bacterium]MBW1954749.1 transcription antitermination factor NusB [Deltaproteobacteria bacterium]MBW2040457.1 transcription antitermination factor NusB [Deltaproteobacteria bacterium]MBW2131882.1 transcription antitermination factor NusB [Deltaproteobacteria bacterium]
MGSRRRSRELAMQALFFMDLAQCVNEDALKMYLKHFPPPEHARAFFQDLVHGVMKALPEIDALIESASDNWKLSRMSGVDRNAMRVAVYELLYREDIPPKVAINEAIDVGKRYGNQESGAFINGILDTIHLKLKKEQAYEA